MPDPTAADLRARILDAAVSILGPGDTEDDPHPDAERIADAVMAVLDEAFMPMLVLDVPPTWTPEDEARWKAVFDEATKGRITVMPPNAVAIRRRAPEQRRAYLVEHRDEALANGIPADLIDMMIADTEAESDD